jgi:hypothetical protein
LSGVINTLERGLCPQPYKEKSFLTGFTGLREGLRDEILPCPDGRTKSNQLLRSIICTFAVRQWHPHGLASGQSMLILLILLILSKIIVCYHSAL